MNSNEVKKCDVCSECSAYADTYKRYSLQRFDPEFKFISTCHEWRIPYTGPDLDTDLCINRCNQIAGVVAIKMVSGENTCYCLAGSCKLRIHEGSSSGVLLKRKCTDTEACSVSCCNDNDPCTREEYVSARPYPYRDSTCKKEFCRCANGVPGFRWRLQECAPGTLFKSDGNLCAHEVDCID